MRQQVSEDGIQIGIGGETMPLLTGDLVQGALEYRKCLLRFAPIERPRIIVIEAGEVRYESDNVVVAMANYQVPKIPGFATELDSRIRVGIILTLFPHHRGIEYVADAG